MLWKVCPHRSVTLAHWWVMAFRRHVVSDQPMRIVLVRRHSELVLIAPLMEVTVRWGPFRERWLQTLANYKSGQSDFLYSTPDPAYFEAFWDELHRIRHWDCVAIWQLPAHSKTETLLLRSAEARKMTYRRLNDSPSWVVRLEGGWEHWPLLLRR